MWDEDCGGWGGSNPGCGALDPCDDPCSQPGLCESPEPGSTGGHGPGRNLGLGTWANNESLGLPAGMNLQPMSLGDLLGLSPGTQCDFGVCNLVGPNSFNSTTTTWPDARPVPIPIWEVLEMGMWGLLLMQQGDGVPKGKWSCKASCNVQGIGNNIPDIDRVVGFGWGNSETDACLSAKRSATQQAPKGSYARHCQCDCQKR